MAESQDGADRMQAYQVRHLQAQLREVQVLPQQL